MIENENYPYKAWMTQPSGKAIEVTVVSRAKWSYSLGFEPAVWVTLDTGKDVNRKDLFNSREEALLAKQAVLLAQQAQLTKRQQALDKKRLTVAKQLNSVKGTSHE